MRSFEDYRGMSIRVRQSATECKLKAQSWALKDELLAQMVKRYLEARAQHYVPQVGRWCCIDLSNAPRLPALTPRPA
jgi:hypothetical protein